MKYEYLVSWIGYDEKTWEPVANLSDCTQVIADFERTQPPEERLSTRTKLWGKTSNLRAVDEVPNKQPPPVSPAVLGELPAFLPLSAAVFSWGPRDAESFTCDVHKAFEHIITWRKNVFKLPSGAAGKRFTQA